MYQGRYLWVHLGRRLGMYLRLRLWIHLRRHVWVPRRRLANSATRICIPSNGKRPSMNESNHLSRWILKLTEDRNGITERIDWRLRGRGRAQRLTVLIGVIERWLSQILTMALGRGDLLGIGKSGYWSPAL